MDKSSLLQRLALIREQTEAANLEVVLGSRMVARLEREGRDTNDAKLQLSKSKMTEQKLLRELDWVLDKLDQVNGNHDR